MGRSVKTLLVILAIITTTLFGISIFSDSVLADGGSENTGGENADSSATEGESSNEGQSCPNNSCNSPIYSGATGVITVPVTDETRDDGIHVPSVCSRSDCSSFNYTPDPESSVIRTGDAPIGSTYYLVAMFADADGIVYIDGVATQVKKGDVLTYIPVVCDGTNGLSSLWSLANSRRASEYGIGMTYSEFMALYHSILPLLKGEFALNKLVGFGSLLKKLGLTEEDLCKIGLCDPIPVIPPTPSCHVGSHAGWTDGQIQVNNLTKGTGWTDEVWARPGDTVRFSMYYCWGVGAVGGSADNNPASPWAIYPGGNAVAYGSPVNQVWFNVSATPNNNYLFGYDEHVIRDTGTQHILTDPHQSSIGGAAPELSSIDEDSLSSDYSFLYFSPSEREEDANSYNCSIFDFGAFTINNSHGYQIPGVGTGSCNAISQNGGNMNDAGTSFSQTITYSYDTAWQRYRHNESGYCDSECTYYPDPPVPGRNSYRKYSDNEKNKLTERNSNTSGTPYKSLEEALSAGVNSWGLVKKHDGSLAEYEHDCDYSSCAGDNWLNYYEEQTCEPCERYSDWFEVWFDSNGDGVDDDYYMDRDCLEYHKGCWGAWTTSSRPESHSQPGKSHYKPPKDYTTGQQQLGVQSSTATVKVPYSYRTSVTSTIQEGDVIYLGETVFSAFTATIIPRIVSEVRPEAYATVVPGHIKAVEFVVDASSNLSPATGSSDAGGSDPCSYYGSLGMISSCNTIWEEEGAGGYLNEEGRYGGKTYSTSVNRVVPDIYPVGSKYCVAVGISTSDSHSQPNTQTVSGMSKISGWRISDLSCRTIAKKPNFQVWNGNFYTKGGIKTSTTVKRVGANLGDPIDPTGYFGSWEEYIISAKGNVTGMSSAAGLGYYGGYNDKMLGLQGGTSPGKSYCDLSRMTISNTNCSNESSGKYYVGNSLIEDSATTVLDRIRSRYLSSTHGITQLENGATYIYPEQRDVSTSSLVGIAHSALSNTQLSSTVIRQTKSAINSESEQTTRNYASNTLIIHVDGKLTIDTDICTGTGTCGIANNLVLTNRNSDYYDNIYSLPQILIIADGGIVISDRVTQIDAWLITNGNINTCNGLNATGGGFSASTCGNQLIVNGPVFANSLTLVRNSGANGGRGTGNDIYDHGGNPIYFNLTDDGSIQPAEIFNLRPDVLYWAYSQAQRFSQANVTYTRELAPRY